MTLETKKSVFVELGRFLSQFSEDKPSKIQVFCIMRRFFDDFTALIKLSQSHNGWYTLKTSISPFNLGQKH
jgi:hypothetical protein